MSKTPEIEEWITKAKEDLIVAKSIITVKSPAWAACFHCQQSVEKIIKAAQIYYLDDYLKEHELEKLLKTLEKYINIDLIKDKVKNLDSYYVSTRYPSIAAASIKRTEAEIAAKDAEEIFQFFSKIIV